MQLGGVSDGIERAPQGRDADRENGKPVGLLVMHGQHAIVMTGFISSGDPRKGSFTLNYVYVSDPLGHTHYRYSAAGSPLDTYLETDTHGDV